MNTHSSNGSNELIAGKYRVVRRLACGGMGEVCLAAQMGPAGFQRLVAIKRVLPRFASDQETVDLFLDEARLVAMLSHRNISQVVELGESDGTYFVAMEFVKGSSVQALLAKLKRAGERLDPFYALEIASQVADALDYAHSATGADGEPLCVVHRDISPHNVLLSTAGDVKLIDFGVAKSSQQEHATQAGMVKGKLAYLSPEQSRGAPLDGRSDLFSLGIVLYEMITGRHPFLRAKPFEQIDAIQTAEAPTLASQCAEWAPLDAVLDRLLAKDPANRFEDGASAARALLDAQAALARPAQRLGSFVSEQLGAELGELAASITDARIRAALTPTSGRLAAAPRRTPPPFQSVAPEGAGAALETIVVAAPQHPARASSLPQVEGETLMKTPARVAAAPPASLADDEVEPTHVLPPTRVHGERSPRWAALGALCTAAVALTGWVVAHT